MNIYISNLSFNVTDDDVRDYFAEYGEVSSAKVIMDKFTGKSRGFAFVEMSDDEAAKKRLRNWTEQPSMEGPLAYPLPSPGKTAPVAPEAAAAVSSVGTAITPTADIKIILYHSLLKGPIRVLFLVRDGAALPGPEGHVTKAPYSARSVSATVVQQVSSV
jgi:hypothetical protein